MGNLSNTVMFACNQGGHFSQMMALKDLFGKYDSVLVTDNVHANKENTPALSNIGTIEYAMAIAKGRKKAGKKKSRLQSIFDYLELFKECRQIWKKHRPAVVITTGSNIAVGLFLYAKLKGSKLIFIETRAKVYSKTITGKLIGWCSDVIFVQWPEMIKVYQNAVYCGTLV